MKNMFTQPLTIYRGEASISPAWREADELRMSAFAGDYRRTEPEGLAGFVRVALRPSTGRTISACCATWQCPLRRELT